MKFKMRIFFSFHLPRKIMKVAREMEIKILFVNNIAQNDLNECKGDS